VIDVTVSPPRILREGIVQLEKAIENINW